MNRPHEAITSKNNNDDSNENSIQQKNEKRQGELTVIKANKVSWTVRNLANKGRILSMSNTMTCLLFDYELEVFDTQNGLVILPKTMVNGSCRLSCVSCSEDKVMVLTEDDLVYCWQLDKERKILKILFKEDVTRLGRIRSLSFFAGNVRDRDFDEKDSALVRNISGNAHINTFVNGSTPVLKTVENTDFWWDSEIGVFARSDRRKKESQFYMLCTLKAPVGSVLEAFEDFVDSCHKEGRAGAAKAETFFRTATSYLNAKKLEAVTKVSQGQKHVSYENSNNDNSGGHNPYLHHILLSLEIIFEKNLVQILREDLLPALESFPGFMKDVVEKVQHDLRVLCPLNDKDFEKNFSILKSVAVQRGE